MKAWFNKTWAGNICLVVFAALLLSLVCGPGSAALAEENNKLINVEVYDEAEKEYKLNPSDANPATIYASDETRKQYTIKIKLQPVTPEEFQNMWMQLSANGAVYQTVYLQNVKGATYDAKSAVYELVYTFVYQDAPFPKGDYTLTFYEGTSPIKTIYLDFEGPPPKQEPPGGGGGGGGGAPAPPAVEPGEPIMADVELDAAGNAVATVDPDVVVQQVKEADVQQVTIEVPEKPGAKAVIVELPGEGILAVAEAGKGLRLETQVVDLVLPPALATAPEVKEVLERGGTLKLELRPVTGTEAETLRSQVPEGAKVVGDIKELAMKVVTASGSERALERFAAPVWVTFGYGAAQVARPDRLGVYRYDEGDGAWVYVGGQVSSSTRTVTVGLYSFSKYALMEYSRTFTDIIGHWAQAEIELMASRHLVAGVGDNRFEPNRAVTRAEFAALLLRALGIPEVKPARPTFGDVSPGAWYYGAAETARRYGLVVGYEDNTFRPSTVISRQEMAAMLVRAFERAGKPQSITPEEEEAVLAAFTDAGRISPWARNAVALALKAGLVVGRADDAFAPQETATRAESVTMLRRFMTTAGLL
ncbi:S-layer homology domain-containing protein [Thermanaeromonas sp. C210]|uniref:S-layer homology domain-containing protein n=1 Tax=Thermanaeromonas sp. C210 TaxID=2731925 RepID=UPI00155C96A0|nr:S-layer homology domain-containing protein [Thermanaeromonas sp. C210]GFN23698.1 hypothetical protein TAMC210_20150 [Thermanaeromonas sp. C210]